MNDFTPNQTQIPNALLDKMATYSDAEFRVAVAVWRHRNAWGGQGNDTPPTVLNLAVVTGLNEHEVRCAVKGLSARRALPQFLRVHQLPKVDTPRTPVDETTRRAIFMRDGTCRWCGSGIAVTIDHIKPVVLGGTNEIENLQVLCHSCNSRKNSHYEVTEEMFIE